MGKINVILIFALGLLAVAALRVENESEFKEAEMTLFNTHTRSGWILLNHVSPGNLNFVASGEGSAYDVREHLKDDQIQFAIIRVDTGSGYKDVFVTWIGPNFFGDAQQTVQHYDSAKTISNLDNINDDYLIG